MVAPPGLATGRPADRLALGQGIRVVGGEENVATGLGQGADVGEWRVQLGAVEKDGAGADAAGFAHGDGDDGVPLVLGEAREGVEVGAERFGGVVVGGRERGLEVARVVVVEDELDELRSVIRPV